MPTSCPYCVVRPCDSDDHIFPAFLGGRKTTPSCKTCNDRFGHSIEAAVSRDLAPVIVMLSTRGLVAPKLVNWRHAYKDPETGIEYDLDSDLQARRSDPVVSRDEAGNMREVFFHDEKMIKKFITAAEKQGKTTLVIDYPAEPRPIPPLNCELTFGLELRRLAMKMAVALGAHLQNSSGLLDDTGRAFLLSNTAEGKRTIRDVSVYEGLEEQRPPLSHLIYLEGDGAKRYCYGVVQLYGLFQIYLILNQGRYDGGDFAALAILNPPMQYSETFNSVKPLKLTPPSTRPRSYGPGTAVWSQKFRAQISEVFGEGAGDVTVKALNPTVTSPPQWTSTSSTALKTIFLTKPPSKTDPST